MTGFVDNLAERLLSHQDFWDDYWGLRTDAAKAAFVGGQHLRPNGVGDVNKLLYCASVFAQATDQSRRALAQSIALSAILVGEGRQSVIKAASSVLASVGNFPSLDFVESSHGIQAEKSSFLVELQLALLRALNTIDVQGTPRALTDFQVKTWHNLRGAKALSISAPTSAGKSFVVIEYLCREIVGSSDRYCAVYVTPTRALLSEVQQKLEERLSSFKDIRVSSVPSLDPLARPKQLYVLTQERLSALLSIADVSADLIIVDEAQNLADGTRGLILQDCLERVLRTRPGAKLVVLSPGATGFPAALSAIGIEDVVVGETTQSPVLQNRIMVEQVDGRSKEVDLFLLDLGHRTHIARMQLTRGIALAKSRLASIALELSPQGGALIYATGPAEAETVCAQLTLGLVESDDERLRDLACFVREHIHGDYGLADMVTYGVAFHYGKMPNLLREAIERSFQEGALKFLVCTTTLFQGVNLPARNVFIRSPVRGQGVALDPALLWNFAGRAGRLGKDIVGNVFLVDYSSWEGAPLDKPVNLKVVPSLSITLSSAKDAVLSGLEGKFPSNSREERAADVRGAVGYLISRASKGDARAVLARTASLSLDDVDRLAKAAGAAADSLGLPPAILERNWVVNPFGLSRLAKRLREKFDLGLMADFLPCRPDDPRAFDVYMHIFNIVAAEVLEYRVKTYGAFMAGFAIAWMTGKPYPVMVSKWIKSKKRQGAKGSLDSLIRSSFDFIEDTLRFQWVQLAKAYISIFDECLRSLGDEGSREKVFDFSLALELGLSSATGRSFAELGLSRVAAVALESLFPDSDMDVDSAREALRSGGPGLKQLSPVIVSELETLGLIAAG